MSLNSYTMVVLQFAILVARKAGSLAGLPLRVPLFATLGFALLSTALTACGGAGERVSAVGLVEGFAGIVVADEPRAAVFGRDTLGRGGNAVDAAVVMYFTMAVTLPSRASLGAGGVCLVYDSSENAAEALLFLPTAGLEGGMVPLGPRAMAALHARHGLRRWAQLLTPAENLARFGHPISRAFARDLIVASSRIVSDPLISRTFRNNAGEQPGEGEKVVQRELASVLGGLRLQGVGYLYSGVFTQRFAAAMTAAGQPVTADEVRASVPTYVEPISVAFGDHTLYFTNPPAADGLVAAQLWEMLVGEISLADAGSAERAHQFVEAAARAFAQRAAWMAPGGEARESPELLLDGNRLERALEGYQADRHTPAASLSPRPVALAENPHGASFIAADRWNNVAACSMTMNGLFGAFQMAPDTGILLAAPPRDDSNGMLSPSAAVLVNLNVEEAYFAAAASGGSAAPTALVSVMLGALSDDMPLDEAVAAPRFHHGGVPDVTFYEEGVPAALLDNLEARGHLLREAPKLGQVNALYCPGSFRRDHEDCRFANDPRGWGLGFLVQ